MDDHKSELAASNDTKLTLSKTASCDALTEVDSNVVPDAHQNSTKSKKDVNWGDDGKDLPSDEENQKTSNARAEPAALQAQLTKTKKKKSKSKGSNKPTGFEEYYVDVPVTPVEFEEEKSIYHRSKTFSERIETAIQRYSAKRKLDPERKDLFDKYMIYGGINSGPKMFGGSLDQKTLEETTAADIAQITATNYVGYDKEDPRSSEYMVDFDGVLKGFLSSRLGQCFETSTQYQVKYWVAIIRNFLNYILHHDVCPEYNDQINAARETCNIAEKELWSVTQASRLLPGDFNKSCSIIFSGSYQNTYVVDQEWTKPLDIHQGINVDRARKIFLAGLAAQGNSEVIQKYNKHVSENKARVVEVVNTGLEILDLECAGNDVLKYYNAEDNPIKGCSPLGKMKVKTWHVPDTQPEDLTEEEEQASQSEPIHTYELWLEDDIMAELFVGMKLNGTLRKLSFGPYFLDDIQGIHCSFYSVLPNELMLGWREHVYLPPRPKRTDSADDNEVEKSRALEEDDRTGTEYEQGENIDIEV